MKRRRPAAMNRRGRVKYPIVRCADPTHPDEPGYVVCGDVLRGEPVGEVVPPTGTSLGQILCADGVHDASTVTSAQLVCAACARRKGWIA